MGRFLKTGKGEDILVTNIHDNPPPPCANHSFSEWESAKVYVNNTSNEVKDHGMSRICRDCGRYEWTEGARA